MKPRWEEIQLMGETAREVGVLIGVFVPVDALFQTPRTATYIILSGVIIGLSLAVVGITVEAAARRQLR